MSYSFTFRGALLENKDMLSVQRDMAALFGVGVEEVRPLFLGDAIFQRNDLTEVEAFAYQAEFKSIGAAGEVEQLTEKAFESEPPVSTLNHQTNSDRSQAHTTAAEQSAQTKPGLTSTRSHIDTREQQNVGRKAASWLKWSSVAIIGIAIADRYLQNTLIIDRVGMDIGYWPLILAHIPLTYGCVLLAKAKGYSPLLGLSGVLSLLGLSVLLIIPDRNSDTNKVSMPTLIFTVFSALLFLNTVTGLQSGSARKAQISLGAEGLHEGRNEYPAPKQAGLEVYKSEQAEMENFIKDTISLIEENNFRPDDVEEISERMFFEFSRYVVWRRYQRFLYSGSQKDLPEGLNDEFQTADEAKFRSLLNGRIGKQGPARLRETKDAWFIAPSGVYDTVSPGETLGKSFNYLWDSVQEATALRSMSSDKAERERVAYLAADIRTQAFSQGSVTKKGRFIKFKIEQGPYAGKVLVIGVSTKITYNRSGQMNSRPRLTVVTHEFPVKYLTKLLGVLDGYAYRPNF